jgi:hypothetical protein
MVKLKIAEALEGKNILLFPVAGAGMERSSRRMASCARAPQGMVVAGSLLGSGL